MHVGAASSAAIQRAGAADTMAKVKQSFDKLGSALESGNLSDAKDALANLQKNAPKGPNGPNPVGEKIDALKQAVDSGDLKAAQTAYADVKSAMSQRRGAGGPPPGGPPPGGPPPGGRPPGGPPPAGGKASASAGDSSSGKVYEKADADKDGTVSAMEQLAYDATHPDETKKADTSAAANAKAAAAKGAIDVFA